MRHFQLIVDKVRRRLDRDADTRPDHMSYVAIEGVSNIAGGG